MGLSMTEAIAAVTAPGQMFEVADVERGGVSQREFVNAPETLRAYFEQLAGDERTFLVYEDEEWSFDRVHQEISALADALVSHFGVAPGDRVGIAMRNLPEWIVSFGAIVSIGAVSVSLNAWWTEDEMAYAIEDAGLALLIADQERLSRSHATCRARGVAMLGVRLDQLQPPPPGVERWSRVVVAGRPLPPAELHGDLDATILYTSGTTGRPKGAVSTHRAVSQAIIAFASNTAVIEARREPGEEGSGLAPCFILIVPLFHVTGCIPVMMSCVAWHFKLVMMYRWEPERALHLIDRHRVTSFVGVPTQAWDLLEHPRFSEFDTSSLVSIGGGGAPAPPTLVARVEASFTRGRPQLGYGMTETNAYGPGNYGEDYVTHPSSTGRVRTAVLDVAIRDDEGRDLPVGERGEIWLKSPTLIRGYWRQPESTSATIVNGWLRTGDVGRADAEGYLYIEDRKKDMILRAGENVYSAEVEAAIYEMPAVYEAAVLGVPHERLGEEVAAVIVRKAGMDLSAESLRDHLADRLAAFKVPTRVAVIDEPLPRNAAGKVLKRELVGRYFA